MEGAVESETACRLAPLTRSNGEAVAGVIVLRCGDQAPVTLTTYQCGNRAIDPGETCDDGNYDDGDGCDVRCSLECGNGRIDGAEQCDDGNTSDLDSCTAACQNATCGDGIIYLGVEECDQGEANSQSPDASCREDCSEARCGDGVTDPSLGEECDDANADNTDACLNDCSLATCGDGVVQPDTESCDNGQSNSDVTADACRTTCVLASCGDGVVDSGEQCDDGNDNNVDSCSNSCTSTLQNGERYSGGIVVLHGRAVLYYITDAVEAQEFEFEVPLGVTELDVTVVGGGGGNTSGGGGGAAGGGGARSVISVTQQSYQLRVGGGMKTHWSPEVYGVSGDSSDSSHPGRTWFGSANGLYATSGGGSSNDPGQGYNGNVHTSRGSSKDSGEVEVLSTGDEYNRINGIDPDTHLGDAGGRGQGLNGFSAESATAGRGLGGGGGGQNSVDYGGASTPGLGGRYGYHGGAVNQNGEGPSGGIQNQCSGSCTGYVNGGGGGSFGGGGGDDGSGQDGVGSGGGGGGGAVLIRWDTVNGELISGRSGFPSN